MLGNKVINPVWVVEEDLNRLKWWTLCKPFEKPVRGDWQTTRARTRSPPRAEAEAVAVTRRGQTAGAVRYGACAWCGRTGGAT